VFRREPCTDGNTVRLLEKWVAKGVGVLCMQGIAAALTVDDGFCIAGNGKKREEAAVAHGGSERIISDG
jgi:hypothetical protein